MKTTFIKNWTHFEHVVQSLRQDLSSQPLANSLIYRGQSNYKWSIESTLERALPERRHVTSGVMDYADYYQDIMDAKGAFESFSNERWSFQQLSRRAFKEKITDRSENPSHFELPLPGGSELYSYMVYLRHHSFPSPLVDFTHSPYVALLYAIVDQSENWSSVYVSNFEYDQAVCVEKNNPVVRMLGSNVRTSTRHHLQQSIYLCCAANTDESIVFRRFCDGLKDFNMQRLLIPRFAKYDMLGRLLEMNLTPYQLTGGSIDALAQTEWLKRRSKSSYVPDIVLVETGMSYPGQPDDHLDKKVSLWLKEHSKIDPFYIDSNTSDDGSTNDTLLTLDHLGDSTSYYDGMSQVASGIFKPAELHEYRICILKSPEGQIVLAIVEDALKQGVVESVGIDPLPSDISG